MDLCNQFCLSSRLAGCLSCIIKALMLDIACKLFNQIFSCLAMFSGTIDFCYFISLSVTLNLPGVIRSAESKTN